MGLEVDFRVGLKEDFYGVVGLETVALLFGLAVDKDGLELDEVLEVGARVGGKLEGEGSIDPFSDEMVGGEEGCGLS
ncbi:MAG: hypothetical protein S4CHLAM102_04510 [Chlamydiia bacterium]|nr:hypothetical protein [Chlamydiia bacterium]